MPELQHRVKDIVDAYTLMGSSKPEQKIKKRLIGNSICLIAGWKQRKPESLANTMNQFGCIRSFAIYKRSGWAGSKEGASAIPQISASMVNLERAARNIVESVGLIETLGKKRIKGERYENSLIKMRVDETNPKIVGLKSIRKP